MRFVGCAVLLSALGCQSAMTLQGNQYYIDSSTGSDSNLGTKDQPWKTLDVVSEEVFEPGDSIFFKRDSRYEGCVIIEGDGTENQPITIGAYGSGSAPRFTNADHELCAGNAMQIRGNHHIVEDLYFHNTAPAPSEVASFEDVWEVGALHVGLGHDHVIIRNNEFSNVPKAIQSYSEYSLITGNYIHDSNTEQQNGFLSEPYWGPIGIQLGIGNQEVSYNTIENMVVEGGMYGADGGAIEIDDGRNHKDNIHIHHNKTHHNMGFVEVSYWDDIDFMDSNGIVIEHNISRDYQSFVLWWAPTNDSVIQNNTIIRDDNQIEGNWNAVFIFDEPDGVILVHKNIVVVDDEQTEAVFADGFNGAIENVDHTDNCYWNADGGDIELGLSFGQGEIQCDPMFTNYDQQEYALQSSSPAQGWGAELE